MKGQLTFGLVIYALVMLIILLNLVLPVIKEQYDANKNDPKVFTGSYSNFNKTLYGAFSVVILTFFSVSIMLIIFRPYV